MPVIIVVFLEETDGCQCLRPVLNRDKKQLKEQNKELILSHRLRVQSVIMRKAWQ